MDHIDLPFIGVESRLNDAVSVMNQEQRSGVLVESTSGPKIFDIDTVLHSLRTVGDLKIARLRPRVATINLPAELSAAKPDLPAAVERDVEALMDGSRAGYAVSAIAGKMASIITRYEAFRGVLDGTPSLWRCTLQGNHIWQMHELWQPGNRCREDGGPTVKI